ncbi:ribosomal protein L7/L12 [Kitasatospora sp. NPDC059722]|uniref:ribosomal protein L7/L12 n=1 Tax=unclassified Kitasatospora TaxID=2633591 RepID=UPI003692BAE6
MEAPAFEVRLTGTPARDATALRAVRAVTGLSLWRSRQVLDGPPAVVQAGAPFDIAVRLARQLREAGVPADVRCDWCRRTLPGDGTAVDPGPCASQYWPVAHCGANSVTDCDCWVCALRGQG